MDIFDRPDARVLQGIIFPRAPLASPAGESRASPGRGGAFRRRRRDRRRPRCPLPRPGAPARGSSKDVIEGMK